MTDPITGEVVCISCGTVVSEKIIDSRPEWRALTNDGEFSSKSRVGKPVSLAIHGLGLSTVIGRNSKDYSGNTIVEASARSIIKRIRIWDYRTQTRGSVDCSRKYAFRQLNNLKEKLALPSPVIEKAAYIYRKTQQKEIVKGRTRTGTIAACVYIACREAEVPRTFREIAEVTDIKRKEMWKAYRAVVSGLDLRVPLVDPVRCLVKLANKTDVNEKVKRYSVEYMKDIMKSNISAGRSPMCLAATVLYISYLRCGNLDKSLKYFAETAGISEVALRYRREELRKRIPD